MKLAHQILEDITRFTGSHYLARIFDIFKSIYIRKVLGPLTMGFFSELSLIIQYGKLHHLGILGALDREIPLSRAKSQQDKLNQIQSVSFTCCIVTAFITALLLLLGYWLPISSDIKKNLALVALFILADSFLSYYRILLRTDHQFNTLSKVNIVSSVVDTFLVVILTLWLGVTGLLVSMIFTSLSGTFIVTRSHPKLSKIPFGFDWKLFQSLIKIGIPLSIYGFIRAAFLSIDRILILFFLDRIHLGYYSIAMMLYNFITPFPKMAYSVLYPRFIESYGRTESLEKSESYLIKPTLVFGYFSPLVAGVGVLFLPFFIHYVLPHFQPGLVPAQILLWGTCCYSLIFMWGYALIALGKQWSMLWFNLMAILFEVIVCSFLVKVCKLGLIGIALGTSMAHFLLSLLLISYVLWRHQGKTRKCFQFLIRLYLPLAGAILVAGIIPNWISYSFSSVWLDFFFFCAQAAIFLVLCGPLSIYYLNRWAPLLKTLKEWQSLRPKKDSAILEE